VAENQQAEELAKSLRELKEKIDKLNNEVDEIIKVQTPNLCNLDSSKDVYFYSIEPVVACDEFKYVPFLKIEDAKVITLTGFFAYVAVLLAFIGVVNSGTGQTVSFLDPWTRDFLLGKDNIFPIASLFLLGVTIFVFLKQWGYYYLVEGGGKQGIIAGEIKTVNHLEKSMDMMLAIFGALLFPLSAFPLQWLLFFAIYTLLVALRCFLTLLRKTFYGWLKYGNPLERVSARLRRSLGRKPQERKKIDVKNWYYDSLNFNYRKKENLKVKFVLTGWVISDLIFAGTSLMLYVILRNVYPWNPNPTIKLLTYVLTLSLILVLYYCIRIFSHPLAVALHKRGKLR
jgi:hypothetical protein